MRATYSATRTPATRVRAAPYLRERDRQGRAAHPCARPAGPVRLPRAERDGGRGGREHAGGPVRATAARRGGGGARRAQRRAARAARRTAAGPRPRRAPGAREPRALGGGGVLLHAGARP